jgi:hypothetical protein
VTGPALARAKASLLAQAAALGHISTTDPDLHLLVDGARIDGEREGNRCYFRLPDNAHHVRLRSRMHIPAHMDPTSEDCRHLGVPVAELAIDGQVSDPAATDGWHPPEQGWQWTNGDARIHCQGAVHLDVVILPLGSYWAETEQTGVRPLAGSMGRAP